MTHQEPEPIFSLYPGNPDSGNGFVLRHFSHISVAFSLVFALATVGSVAPAAGQRTAFVNVGGTVPAGEWASYHRVGLNLAGTFDVAVHEHLAIGARLGWHRVALDDEAMLEQAGFPDYGYSLKGGTSTLLSALATARLSATLGPGRIYGIAGGGYMIRASDDLTVAAPGGSVQLEGGSQGGAAVHAGAGFLAPVDGIGGFGEVSYTVAYTSGEPTAAVAIRIGIAVPISEAR